MRSLFQFKIDLIEVQIPPDDDSKYRILDGAHRFNAYKQIGTSDPLPISRTGRIGRGISRRLHRQVR